MENADAGRHRAHEGPTEAERCQQHASQAAPTSLIRPC